MIERFRYVPSPHTLHRHSRGAFVVYLLVGVLSGERPKDTGRLWGDMFFRALAVMRLGTIGHILNHAGSTGWPQRIL